MQRIGNFNDLSKEYLDTIPKLKENQVVKFKMLNGAANLHPETAERDKQPVIYPRSAIICKDRIKDPHTGKMVDIGVITEMSEDGKQPKTFKMLIPWLGQSPFTGHFFLIGGRDNDDEIYEHLYICNDNGSNPHRNKTVPALFEIMDPSKEATRTNKTASSLRKALVIAEDLSLKEMQEIAASLNWPSDLLEEQLSAKINELAMHEPDKFCSITTDPNTKTKSIIKQAADFEVIKYDDATGKVSNMGINVATLEKQDGVLWLDMMADFCKNHKNGKKVLDNIKAQLKAVNQPLGEPEDV